MCFLAYFSVLFAGAPIIKAYKKRYYNMYMRLDMTLQQSIQILCYFLCTILVTKKPICMLYWRKHKSCQIFAAGYSLFPMRLIALNCMARCVV